LLFLCILILGVQGVGVGLNLKLKIYVLRTRKWKLLLVTQTALAPKRLWWHINKWYKIDSEHGTLFPNQVQALHKINIIAKMMQLAKHFNSWSYKVTKSVGEMIEL